MKSLASSETREVTLTSDGVLGLILELGALVEARNHMGFRTTEVTFANGQRALLAALVPSAMQRFAEAFSDNRLTPEQAYKEFEDIHPFEDGNGRVGDLLWKVTVQRKTGQWPEELPPDMYDDNAPAIQYQSAFGDIIKNDTE